MLKLERELSIKSKQRRFAWQPKGESNFANQSGSSALIANTGISIPMRPYWWTALLARFLHVPNKIKGLGFPNHEWRIIVYI